jgi:phenylpyruvate tautomerase PptA (4-oxalocrotonate tautomerase family)
MPVYTCTTITATLTADIKSALAREISRIHAKINHVPSTYVNVVFHELPPRTPDANSARVFVLNIRSRPHAHVYNISALPNA